MKKLGVKIIALMIIVIILLQVNMYKVMAVVSQTDIKDKENEQKETNSKIEATQQELDEVKIKKSETLSQVQELSDQIADYESQIDVLDGQISQLNSKISTSEKELKDAEDNYNKQQKALDERIIAMYEAGDTSYLDFLLSSESIVDFISNYYLITEVATYDTELLEKIQQEREKIEAAKKELEASKQELSKSKANKESMSSQLQTTKKAKDQQVAQLSADEQKLAEDLQALKNHESAVSSQIDNLKKEWERQQQAKQPTNSGNSNQNNGNSNGGSYSGGSSSYGFGWPVANHSIGTGYGVSGSYWSLGYHTGIDFPVPAGTPVYAIGDGKVVDTGYNSAYGNFVEIYHGSNIYSFYAHATSVIVGLGADVTKGQQIMRSGATGNVTGAHLHFEIRTPGSKFANCVNPRGYLP